MSGSHILKTKKQGPLITFRWLGEGGGCGFVKDKIFNPFSMRKAE
jgi:hypothetical protein